MHTDTIESADLTLLNASEVRSALQNRERALIDLAQDAYLRHKHGHSALPNAEFLRFPGRERERIIAKQGYLGGAQSTAGIKWIASFPDNVGQNLPRASALMILNSTETGRPTAVLEGSIISCERTAAGAALGARLLHRKHSIASLGVVGCGPINAAIVRYIVADAKPVGEIVVFDLSTERAASFVDEIAGFAAGIAIRIAASVDDVLRGSDVVSFATSAVTPTVDDLSICPEGATILHISLRDLTPRAILQAENIVDDLDHVLQARTSVHLTEMETGDRAFIRGTLADVAEGMPPRAERKPVVLSPFGLAVLDLAFAEFVRREAQSSGSGTVLKGFLPC